MGHSRRKQPRLRCGTRGRGARMDRPAACARSACSRACSPAMTALPAQSVVSIFLKDGRALGKLVQPVPSTAAGGLSYSRLLPPGAAQAAQPISLPLQQLSSSNFRLETYAKGSAAARGAVHVLSSTFSGPACAASISQARQRVQYIAHHSQRWAQESGAGSGLPNAAGAYLQQQHRVEQGGAAAAACACVCSVPSSSCRSTGWLMRSPPKIPACRQLLAALPAPASGRRGAGGNRAANCANCGGSPWWRAARDSSSRHERGRSTCRGRAQQRGPGRRRAAWPAAVLRCGGPRARGRMHAHARLRHARSTPSPLLSALWPSCTYRQQPRRRRQRAEPGPSEQQQGSQQHSRGPEQ